MFNGMALALKTPFAKGGERSEASKRQVSPNMGLPLQDICKDNLLACLKQFSSLPTRNTNTEHCIAALDMLEAHLSEVPGVEIVRSQYHLPAGKRVPNEMMAEQIEAILPGEDDQRIVIGAHIDSLNKLGSPFSDLAPGANDNLSGVAVILECVRLMAMCTWRHTIHFVFFTGEEQGLVGAHAYASDSARRELNITAMLNLDTIGGCACPRGAGPAMIRIFSEGGESSPSREIARYIEWLAATTSAKEAVRFDPSIDRRRLEEPSGMQVKLILRQDRLGRGGDHSPFNLRGFPAVRFSEVDEDFERQHTVDDTVAHVHLDSLHAVAKLTLHLLTSLADAEEYPQQVRIVRELSRDTTVTWDGSHDQTYIVYRRPTDGATWQECDRVRGLSCTLKESSKDDLFYAVGSIGGVPVPAE